jgi:hypothetical protein
MPEAIRELVAEAVEDSKANILLIVTDTEAAPSVSLSIAAASVREIADADMTLTMQSDNATIVLDTETLAGIVEGVAGDVAVSIVAAVVDALTGLNTAQQEIVGNNPVVDLSILVGGVYVHSFAGTVTVRLPFDVPEDTDPEDYDLLTVYHIDDNGNIKEMAGVRFDARTGIISFTTTFSLFFISEWISPFSDVRKSDWFYRTVRQAFADGLMVGTGGDAFSPNANISRAMLLTMLWRIDGAAAAAGGRAFADVQPDHWFAGAVAWASAYGISDGRGDGSFGPNDAITREEIAVILHNYADHRELISADTVVTASFVADYSDADSISADAQGAMRWANANGLITGRTMTTLAPQGLTTRAEAAATLQRFIARFTTT